jgi:CRP/FNR family transcriptional regulator
MHVQPIKLTTAGITIPAVTQPPTLPCDRCASRSLGICAPLGNRGLARLVAMGGQRRWDKRQVLYYGDAPAQTFYKITKGTVAESKMLADGRRQIVAILTVGDLCGYPAEKGRHAFTAVAITAVEACAFAAAQFRAYMERNVELACAVADHVAERLKHANLGRTVVGQLRSFERVAHFILEMEERLRLGGALSSPVELHLTREEIADYLGLTLETVSRAFSKLKQMGLIWLAGADVVVVPDRKRLSEVAWGR